MTSRKRSTVPPSMSTQRNIGVCHGLLCLTQQRVGLRSLCNIALEEDDAAGLKVASMERRCAETLVPSKPMISNWPTRRAQIEAGFRWHGDLQSKCIAPMRAQIQCAIGYSLVHLLASVHAADSAHRAG